MDNFALLLCARKLLSYVTLNKYPK